MEMGLRQQAAQTHFPLFSFLPILLFQHARKGDVARRAAEQAAGSRRQEHHGHAAARTLSNQLRKRLRRKRCPGHERFKGSIGQHTAQKNPRRDCGELQCVAHGKDAPLHLLGHMGIEQILPAGIQHRYGQAAAHCGQRPDKRRAPRTHEQITEEKAQDSGQKDSARKILRLRQTRRQNAVDHTAKAQYARHQPQHLPAAAAGKNHR